jgi:hypothetical protein
VSAPTPPTMDELRARRDALLEEKAESGDLSRDRRRTARDRASLDRGIHPATRRPLLTVEPGTGRPTCGDCGHAQHIDHHDRSYWKCARHRLGMSHSAASDIRKGWPACELFQTTPDEGTPT